MKRRALITGCSGQDGSYLAELLLEKDYEVYGLLRRTSTSNRSRIRHLEMTVKWIPGDLSDQGSLARALKLAEPEEVYNLAAQSYVTHSFEAPLYTSEVTGLGAVRLFEAMRMVCPFAKVYQASSSEQFGQAFHSPQSEETPFRPLSPYGCAKTFAHHMAQTYRASYGLFISCGIAYNHESPRRGEEFVTRKITKAVGQIKAGLQDRLSLGNTASKRDWSHAKDIVRGMWLMLQQETPGDYVLASGEAHSVQEFVEYAFNYAGLEHQQYVKCDPMLLRPMDIPCLIGNAEKAARELRWVPSIRFADLVKEMVNADLVDYSPIEVS